MMVLVLASVNLGSIRKAEDPIRDTQTNGILYKQKMEEEKDGKKGPLLYNVKYNPKEKFFIEPPYEKKKEPGAGDKTEKTPATSDWWEEKSPGETAAQPAEQQASGEAVTPEEVPPLTEEPAAQPAAGARDGEEKKPDDYWW